MPLHTCRRCFGITMACDHYPDGASVSPSTRCFGLAEDVHAPSGDDRDGTGRRDQGGGDPAQESSYRITSRLSAARELPSGYGLADRGRAIEHHVHVRRRPSPGISQHLLDAVDHRRVGRRWRWTARKGRLPSYQLAISVLDGVETFATSPSRTVFHCAPDDVSRTRPHSSRGLPGW